MKSSASPGERIGPADVPSRDTVNPEMVRWLIDAGLEAGACPRDLARIPGASVLGQGGIRLPATSVIRAWETIYRTVWDNGGSRLLLDLWRPGTLGVWDYLFTAGATLADALQVSAEHSDAGLNNADTVRIVRDDDDVSVIWRTIYPDNPAYACICELVPALIQAPASAAAGRPLTPVRVLLDRPALDSYEHLVELYGTRNIEFDAGLTAITFAESDADRPLPGYDKALAAILTHHARLVVTTARPVLGWLDRFHLALETSWGSGFPDLPLVARALAVSPRTLQRRLREEGTSWRAEVEYARYRRVDHLLRETSLTMESIAGRAGYTDSRTLRRAVHRWYGHGPAQVRGTRTR